ncbi:MAG: mechanosensitive ion channel [Acidobacteria bacterium]|nr:mechanosensitive ion channel [Acidobacteriota bacterium]
MNELLVLKNFQAGALALLVLIGSLVARRWMLRRLRPFPQIADGIATPSLLWCLVIGIDALLNFIELPARATTIANYIVVSFLILSLTMVVSAVLIRVIQDYGERHNMPFAVAGLSRTLTRSVVFAVGLLVLLRFLGISITPVLATLGVGGLAVALALQDTLANFFAGVHILVERPIAVGDYVRLTEDEQGTVSDIGWRTTRLLTTANNIVVIPNKTITSGNLLNYSMPSNPVSVFIPIVLAHDADVDKASELAVKAALGTEGVASDPPPVFLADPGMTPTHLQFCLAFQVSQFLGSGLVRTAVLQKILTAFHSAQIALPDPTRLRGRQ